jgi:hypothetical protein
MEKHVGAAADPLHTMQREPAPVHQLVPVHAELIMSIATRLALAQ